MKDYWRSELCAALVSMAFSSAKALRPAGDVLLRNIVTCFNGLLIGQGVAPPGGGEMSQTGNVSMAFSSAKALRHGGGTTCTQCLIEVSMAFSSAKALRLLGIFAKEIVWFLRDFVQTPQRDVQRNSVAKA